MVVIVKNKSELKKAVLNREDILVDDIKLIKMLKPLMYVKKVDKRIKKLLEFKTNASAGVALSTLVGLEVPVAIVLIVAVGIVTIVAILSEYEIEYDKYGKLRLKPTKERKCVS